MVATGSRRIILFLVAKFHVESNPTRQTHTDNYLIASSCPSGGYYTIIPNEYVLNDFVVADQIVVDFQCG